MKKLGSIVFIALVLVLLGGAMFVLSLMQRPLGPSLALDVPPTQPLAAGAVQPAAAQPAAAQPQQKKTCGNTGKMSILVIGQGLIENANLFRSGAVRLVVVDFDQPKVSILSMPGELWVDAKVLKDDAIPFNKLDLIYNEVFQKSGNPEEVAHVKGTQALAQAVVDNFGFVPDHYVTVLQQPFIDLVDTLGGVDVNLPAELDSTYGNYPAGPQHLDGLQTLNLTRADPLDTGYNAWARFDRQDIVLQGLLAAIKQPDNWSKAPELLKEARKAVLTDLSVDQVNDLKCMLEETNGKTNMLEVDEGKVTVDGEGHWNPNIDAIKGLIQQMYSD